MVVAYVITLSFIFYQVAGVLWIITAFLVSMIRPYKVDVYTTLDTFLLTCSAAWCMLIVLAEAATNDELIFVKTSAVAISVLAITPLLYIMHVSYIGFSVEQECQLSYAISSQVFKGYNGLKILLMVCD